MTGVERTALDLERLKFEGRRVRAVRVTVEGLGVVDVEPAQWAALLLAVELVPELARERAEALDAFRACRQGNLELQVDVARLLSPGAQLREACQRIVAELEGLSIALGKLLIRHFPRTCRFLVWLFE